MDKWVWHPENPTLNGPEAGSWFHILFIFIMLISTFLMAYFLGRKHDRKIERYVTLIFGCSLIVLETFRQVLYIQVNGYFRFEHLPWDLCSVPMYLSIVSFFIKDINNPVKKGMDIFNIFFGFIGGVAVMLHPVTLATPFVYRSLQTMLWHVILAVYAIYLFVSREYYKMKIKEVVPAVCIFLSVALIAVTLNETLYFPLKDQLERNKDYINLFFLSSHIPSWISIKVYHKYPLINAITNPALYIILYMIITSSLCFAFNYVLKSPYLIYKKYFKKPEVYQL